jgi:hypothetical protein
VTDQFRSTAKQLLRLLADLPVTEPPPRDEVKLLRDLRSFLAVQRDNSPVGRHTQAQMCVIDVGDATLAWVADPADPRAQATLAGAKAAVFRLAGGRVTAVSFKRAESP